MLHMLWIYCTNVTNITKFIGIIVNVLGQNNYFV